MRQPIGIAKGLPLQMDSTGRLRLSTVLTSFILWTIGVVHI